MIKSGVELQGIQPEMVLAYGIAKDVYRRYQAQDFCVLTSCKEGQHKRASLHYKGFAIDLRHPPAMTRASIVQDLKAALGAEYDVIEEHDHIHIEFDPKYPATSTGPITVSPATIVP